MVGEKRLGLAQTDVIFLANVASSFGLDDTVFSFNVMSSFLGL